MLRVVFRLLIWLVDASVAVVPLPVATSDSAFVKFSGIAGLIPRFVEDTSISDFFADLGLGRAIWEVVELLQYPGLGPISAPPLQYIFACWQLLQLPGVVGAVKRYSYPEVHSTQAPVSDKASPSIQYLKAIGT